MAHKIAVMFSVIFVFQLLLMMGDITAIQVIQSEMQAHAVTLVHEIALKGRLDQTMMDRTAERGYTLVCLVNCLPQFGDTLTFQLTIAYDPMVLSDQPLFLQLTRDAVVGVYY